MPSKKAKPAQSEEQDPRVSIYPAWCKKCGNCVAFCPVKALEQDEWGYPRLANPDKCTNCHLCEKLCPDFAISVGEPPVVKGRYKDSPRQRPGRGSSQVVHQHSPERVLPTLEQLEEEKEADRDEE